MPRGSRIVDEYQIVQDVRQFVIALGGLANSVMKASVACQGVVRQFWPPTMPVDNPIVMTTEVATSYDIKNPNEGQPQAICHYDAQSGNLILSSPTGNVTLPVLAPVPRGTGQYLFKFDVLAGTFVMDDADGVWLDVFSEGSLGVKEYYLPNTTGLPGQVLGQATVSVAQDNGGGGPAVGTTVVKTINFIAELTGNNIIFTQDPWTLTDNQVNEVARARVDVGSDGVVRGYEHNIEVRTEVYALNWNSGFTVQADLVAGAVSGSTLGVPLGTATLRTWEVAAGVGTSNTGTIDLTITDGVTSITKQITLIATSTEETSTSDLSDDWTTFLRITDEETTYSGQSAEAGGRVIFYPDGTMDAFTYTPPTHYPFGLPGYPLNWNTSAPTVPDPENFEIMVTPLDGDPPVGPLEVWRNLSTQQEWHIDAFARAFAPFETEIDESRGAFLVSIREVGRPDTVKLKTIEIDVIATSNGTGISIP